MSRLLMLLLCTLALQPVVSTRINTHARGLDQDHQEGTYWPVTSQDEIILRQVQTILNPPGADVPWKWQNTRAHWTFGLVKLTSQDAKGALVLHMLHRHGLAPLLASRAGEEFMQTFDAKLQANTSLVGNDKAKALVEAQEEFGQIQHLRELLGSLSLSGLRNLHSYDHQWSVSKGAGKQDGCSQEDAGGCVLQAGYSRITNNFLRENGFSHEVSKSIQSAHFRIMVYIFNPLGYWNLAKSTRDALTTTKNTGDITVSGWELHTPTLFGSKKVVVDVEWEGGAETTLSIKIDEEAYDSLSGGGLNPQKKKQILADLVDNYIEKKLSSHKKYMHDNRLTVWAGEEAEFCDLHDNLPESEEESTVSFPNK